MKNVMKVTLGVVMLGSVLFGATAAFGSSVPAGGTINVFATPNPDGIHATILITGAIGDYGKALTIDKHGKADANGNYVKITLHKGTFEINSGTLNANTKILQPTIHTTTCSVEGSGTGSVTLFGGTGLYKGITGTVNISETFAFIGSLYKSGKNKGQCNLSNSAQPIAQYGSITGTGTVSF